MREFMVTMQENGQQVYLHSDELRWIANRWQAKLFTKGHATRVAKLRSQAYRKNVTVEKQ